MVELNPMAPEFQANPYPTYEELRRDAPVLHSEAWDFYAVSRYDDVVQVLKSPKLFSSSAISMNISGKPTRTIINTDPPLHANLRNMVNRAFTPRMVADMEPRIREITAGLLDRVAAAGQLDLVNDLAIPLPVTVIAEILGVESERHADFKRWSNAVVGAEAATTDEEREEIGRDVAEFCDYFARVIEDRSAEPRDDLISALVTAARDDADVQLTPDDLLGFTGLLLIAGNETTTNLIGNAVMALLRHPEQMEQVLANRALLPNFVEEALRWDSPVQFMFRTATADTEIAGTKIPAGATVIPIYASGNRDDSKFPDAARFDITRNTQGHLAFGLGIHFCLGAPLARLEARVALEQLLLRMPALRRIDEAPLERVRSIFLRGIRSLPLEFDAAAVAA